MKLTEEQRATIRRIRHLAQKDFMTLVRLAGLDPKSDFRHANLRSVNFGGADLREFDFTGTDLSGADLRFASINGAIWTDTDTTGTLWPEKRNTKVTGTVKWFNAAKGYGFIAPEDGEHDVFFHISDLERSGIRGLNEGQKVGYELARGNNGKEAAVNINLIDLD